MIAPGAGRRDRLAFPTRRLPSASAHSDNTHETKTGLKDLPSLKVFTRVARLGSFSAAARECNLSQSQVSRIISDLEADLGARLLSRTTRTVKVTDSGAEFLVRIEAVLAALDEAEHGVRGGEGLRGVLRMSAPSSIAVRELIPRLAPFAAMHPDLHIDVRMGDQPQDLVKDAVDVAIRVGNLADSTATTMLITHMPRVIVASPAYLTRKGTPIHPEMLLQHRIVGGPAADVPTAWRFDRDGEEVAVSLEPHFRCSENEGAVSATVAGLGITSTTVWACHRELQAGSLVRILADWKTARIPLRACLPMGRATRPAGRAVVDYLIEDFRRTDASGPAA